MNDQSRSGAPGRVFISYVHEDRGRVEKLERSLRRAGISTLRDADIPIGTDWKTEIRKAIEDDQLAAFLACFSEHTDQRPNYQNEELRQAVSQMRLRKPGHRWLIPVRFADCQLPEFELSVGQTLDRIQRVDLFGANKAQATLSLVGALRDIVGNCAPSPARALKPTHRLFGLAGALAAIMVVAFAVLLPSAGKDLSTSHAFPSRLIGKSLVVTRSWKLSGAHGQRFSEMVYARSTTGKRIVTVLTEPIPSGIPLSHIVFHPRSSGYVKSAHVIAYVLVVPANGITAVGYTAQVAAEGAAAARMRHWLKSFDSASSSLSAGHVELVKAVRIVVPEKGQGRRKTIQLRIGQTARLRLQVTMANGRPAQSAIVELASWVTKPGGVAEITASGRLTAVAVGLTRVTVTIERHSASVYVHVIPQPSANGYPTQQSGNPAPVYSSTPSQTQAPSRSQSPPPSSSASHKPPTSKSNSSANPIVPTAARNLIPKPVADVAPLKLLLRSLKHRQHPSASVTSPSLLPRMALAWVFGAAALVIAALARARYRFRRKSPPRS